MEKGEHFWRRVASPVYFKRLYCELLQGNRTLVTLTKNTGMSYSYFCQVINEAEKEGFIKKTKFKNTFLISLTPKGRVLAKLIQSIVIIVEQEGNTDEIIKNLLSKDNGKM